MQVTSKVSSTLHLTASAMSVIKRATFIFLLTTLLAAAGGEALARSALGAGLPAPSVGADNFLLDAKLYALESQIRRDGRIDCLFVGSSVTNSDIDPAIVAQAYAAQTGESIHCYNIGIPVMTADNTIVFSRALIQRFHPRVVFFTVLPRDISPFQYNADYIENSVWVKYNSGQPSLHGWLVNNLYAYRYLLSWRYLLVVENRIKRSTEIEALTCDGFQPAQGIHPPDPKNPFSSAQELQEIWKDQNHSSSILKVGALQTQYTRVIVIEGPLNRSLDVIGASPQAWSAYETEYLPKLAELLNGSSTTLWRTDSISAQIPFAHWYDWRHLNAEGAQTFSQWLGELLAENKWIFE